MAMPITLIRAKFLALKPVMDERLTRLWAGAEAEAIGAGGITLVAEATGMSRTTIRAGRDELRKGVAVQDVVNVRRAGAGRPSIEQTTPEILDALEHLLEPATRGDRESPLRWTAKSTRKLSAELGRQGFSISPQKVAQLLHASGYRLQGVERPGEGASHALRGQQLELINERVKGFQARGAPVIAVDTRKQQLAPALEQAKPAWRRENAPVPTHDVHDREPGKLGAPGVPEVARDAGWVNDTDHDTPAFAVRAIADWWEHMARRACGDATELLVIADAGSSNSAGARRWKAELQLLADRTGLTIGVSHFPPGTSKWTQIEHRLICRVTESWCGRPPTGGFAPRPAGGAVGAPTPHLDSLDPTGGFVPRSAPHLASRDPTGGFAPRPAGRAVGAPTPHLASLDRETVVQLIGGARPVARSGVLPSLDARGLPAEWNYTLHPRRERR